VVAGLSDKRTQEAASAAEDAEVDSAAAGAVAVATTKVEEAVEAKEVMLPKLNYCQTEEFQRK